MGELRDLSFGDDVTAILFGTSKTPNDSNLQSTPQVLNNIRALTELFMDPSVVGLSPSSVHRIVDEEHASSALTKIDSLSKSTTGTLFVYYVGHGLYGDEKSDLYLTTVATTDDTKSSSGVPIEDIKRAISNSRARRKILVLDCCYSGAAHREGLSGSNGVAQLHDLEGTFVVTASAANRKALARQGSDYTEFTGELISVLDDGIEGAPRMLTMKELVEDVAQKLSTKGDAPLPEVSNWKNGGDFRFAFNQYGQEKDAHRVLSLIADLDGRLSEGFSLIGSKVDANDEAAKSQAAILQDQIAKQNQEISSLRIELEKREKEIKEINNAFAAPWIPYVLRLRYLIYSIAVLLLVLFFALSLGSG